MYTENIVQSIGKCDLIVTNLKNSRWYQLKFVVQDGKYHRLFWGNTATQAMDLIRMQSRNCIAAVQEVR